MSPIYINSKNESINTSEMSQPHLERALAKSQREGNDDNTKALQEELTTRGEVTENSNADISVGTDDAEDISTEYDSSIY